jgi:hypothetical protein
MQYVEIVLAACAVTGARFAVNGRLGDKQIY